MKSFHTLHFFLFFIMTRQQKQQQPQTQQQIQKPIWDTVNQKLDKIISLLERN